MTMTMILKTTTTTNEDNDEDDEDSIKLSLTCDILPPIDSKFGIEFRNKIVSLSTKKIIEAYCLNMAGMMYGQEEQCLSTSSSLEGKNEDDDEENINAPTTTMSPIPIPTSPPLSPLPSITILWATQTGRAKACARRTVRLLKSTIHNDISHNNMNGLCAFDELDFLALGQSTLNHHELQQQSILIVFVRTTGDAEQTSSIQKTWSHLLFKSLPTKYFANAKFALFALGDRAYGPDAFCAAGRKLATRLVR
jgi:flavodoxin